MTPGTGISTRTRNWLNAFHIYLGCVWGGGASSLFALHCLYNPNSGPELYARNIALIYIDNYLLVPSAIGCLLTGLLYCHFTKWGYLRYHWVIVKWASTAIFTLAGFLWFIPWLEKMAELSTSIRAFTTVDPTYGAGMYLHMAMAAAQALLVLFLVIISVFKPWGKTKLGREKSGE